MTPGPYQAAPTRRFRSLRTAALAILAVGVAAMGLASIGETQAPRPTAGPDVASCSGTFELLVDEVRLWLPFCSNRSITTRDAGVRRLIVVVHGDARNSDDYLDAIRAAAEAAGATDTLVVAPQFRTIDDEATQSTPDGLYFSSNGWKEGATSEKSPLPRRVSISSFAAVDDLVRGILTAGAFPNLRTVVMTGHSAGGQFVERYAATSPLEDGFAGSVQFLYVVANPSSYLYFDARRPEPGGGFEEPSARDRRECPDYDTWKYGLAGRNAYAAASDATAIRARYARRAVVYLLGADDSNPDDPSLDTSCAAEWQGEDRLDRGRRHFAYIGTAFGEVVYGSHVLAVVPGVGHDGPAMYLSDAAMEALFGDPG